MLPAFLPPEQAEQVAADALPMSVAVSAWQLLPAGIAAPGVTLIRREPWAGRAAVNPVAWAPRLVRLHRSRTLVALEKPRLLQLMVTFLVAESRLNRPMV